MSPAKCRPFCLGHNILNFGEQVTVSSVIFMVIRRRLGPYSLSGRTPCRKILWSLEVARFWFRLSQSLRNLTGTSAELMQGRLSNFRAMRLLSHSISWLRHFTGSYSKESLRLVNRGPGDICVSAVADAEACRMRPLFLTEISVQNQHQD